KVPHGIANALFLIPMFKRNILFFPEKLKFIINILQEKYDNQHLELSIENALNRFFKEINFSRSASKWGVLDNQFDLFARQLYADSYRFRNQYGEFSIEEICRIFKESL
ncbi:MAG: hypothetical protein ACP5KS_14750, partial [Candidatus Hydrogenedens sp.]